MREKMLNDRASRVPLLVVVLLLLSLVPFFSANLRSAAAAGPSVTTSIIGNAVTGNASTQVVPPPQGGNLYGIQGGQTAGKNLFHSFSQFNLGPGDIAQFQTSNLSPTVAISNILGRINGQQSPSQIFGTIDSATYYPAANLFLMNPYGFLFGPNATVNVGGMMTFTTADYMRLANGGRFNANPNTLPGDNLISADVVAFGFLGTNLHPAEIRFEGGQLTVAGGTGLTLVGGDINLLPDASGTPSSITAHGRSIQMISVAGPGEVAADTGTASPGMALGTITLMGQGPGGTPTLDTSGDPSFGDGSGSGGPISIRGGQLMATGTTITTSPAAGSIGSGGAVTVDVTGSATFTDSQIVTGGDAIAFSGSGSGGAVSITANASLSMMNTLIDTSAFFAGGDGGPVTLKTNGPLTLTDANVFTLASAPGNGGAIVITGKDVTVNGAALVADVDTGFSDVTTEPAMGQVHPGTVTITGEETVTLSNTYISAQALSTLRDAGSVTITGKTVDLSNGTIDVSMHMGLIESPGNGGTIEIRGNNVNVTQFHLLSLNDGSNTSPGRGGTILLRGADNPLADNIQLTTATEVNTNATAGGGGGTIEFQTKGLTVSNSVVGAATFGPGPGGSITIQGANNVILDSSSAMETSAVNSGSQGPFGPAGPILLETKQLTMQGGSTLRSADLPLSKGNAGSITVRGTNGPAQSILIDGAGTGMFTDAEGTGAGGNISLSANSVTIQNGGILSATTSGTVATATGGTINVNANTVTLATGGTMTAKSTGAGASGEVIVQGLNSTTQSMLPAQSILIDGATSGIITNTSGTGAGGDIHLFANSVTLQNSGSLSAATSGTAPSATGGMVQVNAEHVALNSHALITADTNGIAPAGQVEINTGTLTVNGGGQIRTSSGAAELPMAAAALSAAVPLLTGGTITIQGRTGAGSQADSVSIDGAGSGLFTETAGHRPGGDINTAASQSVTMTNGATMSASSTGQIENPGNAGSIDITATNGFSMQNSTIRTQAAQGASGGDIKITTSPAATVFLQNSMISASVADGPGGGGNISIDPQFVILLNSQILAKAAQGQGGAITINANLFLPDATSVVNADSGSGQNGTITIQSPIAPASGRILPLPQKPLIGTTLLSQRCAALAGGNFSSFTVAGRDSLPAEPSGWLSSPLALVALSADEGDRPVVRGEGRAPSPSPLPHWRPPLAPPYQGGGDGEGETPLLSLRQIAPPGFLTQAFAVDWSAGCTS